MQALYWKYDTCAVEEIDMDGEFCTGWCVAQVRRGTWHHLLYDPV